ncbi:RHS repeat-associated core domain-containing protein [Moraxella cuniculi DSM 21768]|uniref:RHS repeat-associated core domain-containing protein n=1 Tax=Moraxella cuniculi DSM 21768 TaxID=1122245 RepID=A0A1N7G143_9GAMM|nr:RHS repeat-associated core domain-containing protein [Moraxella cuniculi]OOS07804.1 hypothetical protein B0189_01990 [Moraxella cuniculi]SIS06287.1 RHS repeat-associated core domain-containing protein [Moraxella cuniculi DSM 21768]
MIGYKKSLQFFYNPNNELSKTVVVKDVGLQITKTTTQYHYDAFGRRIAKNSKVETLNKLNQQGKLVKYPTTLLHLRKTDKTQNQTTLMLWEGNRQIQEYTDDFVFTTVYDQSFEPVSRLVQNRQDTSQIKVYHYHNNHLGTPQELTDDCGNVVWVNYEWAWGGTYQSYYKEQSLNNIPIDKDYLQPIKFQGQFFDTETSLHYNRFRYYDSDVGMFISRDPIGLLGGLNTFQYAPNPIHWVDPWGLKTVNAKVVQFSQDSVSTVFDNGNKLNSLTHAMSNNPNYYQGVNPIRVIKFQDLPSSIQTKLLSQGANPYGIYSLDNRRLLAAKEAGSKINIKFVKPKDVPDINLEKRFSTKNGGKLPTKRC